MKEQFTQTILDSYTFKGKSVIMGASVIEGEVQHENFVRIPLETLNRHGLVSGATGTGKTKSIQLLTEKLSNEGVPVLLMDLKGDLSGLAAASPGHERHQLIGTQHVPSAFPLELLTISDLEGVRLRATVSEFGPVLLGKILDLNETQSGVLAVVFKYCDDNGLPLLDLEDLKTMLKYIASDEGKDEIESDYGYISIQSIGAISRKILELETQNAQKFFGEISFDVNDLTRVNKDGKGVVSVLKLTDMQSRPKLFSTFMLCLLAEVFEKFPEEGDLDQPKLVIVIEESHLLFSEGSKALLDQIETVIKLIRSKGVGIIFSTQNPKDIPSDVLSQLGMKIQHALRAFTAKDRKAIKLVSENFPESDFYEVNELITELGIGEALITALDEKGRPTELVHTMLEAPASRMDVLEQSEINELVANSKLIKKYNKEVDRQSAHEIMTDRLEEFAKREEELEQEEIKIKNTKKKSSSNSVSKALKHPLVKDIGRTVGRELTRGLLGVLGIKK